MSNTQTPSNMERMPSPAMILAADQDVRNLRRPVSELSFDEAEALGFDGTGRS